MKAILGFLLLSLISTVFAQEKTIFEKKNLFTITCSEKWTFKDNGAIGPEIAQMWDNKFYNKNVGYDPYLSKIAFSLFKTTSSLEEHYIEDNLEQELEIASTEKIVIDGRDAKRIFCIIPGTDSQIIVTYIKFSKDTILEATVYPADSKKPITSEEELLCMVDTLKLLK